MFNRRTLLTIAVAIAPALAAAQATNNDYYGARASQQSSDLLTTVEKYHLQQGIDKMRSRLWQAAWGDFNFILSYFPNHPRALLLMSELCQSWHSPKCNMGEYFEKAIQISPNNAGVHLTMGVYLQKRGKLNEAIESYKKSLEISPDSANAHYNLGLAYLAKKENALANEHAQKAYALGVTLPGLRNKLVAAGAWKELEPKPAPAAQKSGETTSGETKPGTAETETRAKDGSK